MRPGSSERGSAPLEMVLAVGFLLIPAMALMAQLPTWVAAHHAAQAASVEASRAVVLADSMSDGIAAANITAAAVLANHDFGGSALVDVVVSASPSGELTWGQQVTVAVTVTGPRIFVPGVGEMGAPFAVTRSATERVDDYRSLSP